jgi:hypothetical protein
MAQVPGVPLPSVSPNASQLPYQQISAPKGAFAAAILGDAAASLGAAAEHAAADLDQHAERMAAIDNKLAVDDATAAYTEFTDQHSVEFTQANRGFKAQAALPDAMKALAEQRNQIASTLTNPTAKTMFLGDSRLAAARAVGALSRFASSQREEALTAQSNAVISALMNDNFKHADSPDFNAVFQENANKAVVHSAFRAEQLGLSKEVAEQYARDTYGKLVEAQVKNLFTAGKVTQASAFLDAHSDGMNPMAFAQLQGQLKPALFANNAATLADQVVGETLGVRAPKANPDEALASFRTDPAAAIRAATGLNVQVTSGYRDPAHNAAVGGAAGSEHTLNAAWDIVPPKGVTMVQLAQRIHDSGIPYDQLEVQGNHVHVGFKPGEAQRGMIIGDLAGQVHNPSINSALGGAMTSYELKAKEATLEDRLRARALAEQPGNMAYADMVVSRGLTQLHQTIQARSYAEQDAGQTLLATVAANNITDLPTLMKQPGMAALYNSIPQSSRASLQAAMNRDANQPSLERTDNFLKLYGMMHDPNGPGSFMQQDLGSVDLTAKDRLALGKKQIEFRQKADAMADSNRFTTAILKSPDMQTVLKQLNITDVDSPEALRLKGAVASLTDIFTTTHPGKIPTDIERTQILQQAQQYMLSPGVSVGSLNMALAKPPPEVQAIIDRGRALGYPTTQEEAYKIYAGRKNAQ